MRFDSIELKNRLLFNISSILLIVITCFFAIIILTGRSALGFLNQKWDGVTVAASFSSGKGTDAEPYLISNSYELAYFSKVINEKVEDTVNGGFYYTKSYKLNRDIDLGGYSWNPIGIDADEKSFQGKFDGDGHTIYDIKLTDKSINSNTESFNIGLFGKVDGGSIKNIYIDTLNVEFDNYESNKYLNIGSVAGSIYGTGSDHIQNISVKNVNYTGSIINNKTVYSSLLIGNVSGNYAVDNIIISGNNALSFKNELDNFNGFLTGYNKNTSFTNVLYMGNDNDMFGDISSDISIFSYRIYSINNKKNYEWMYANNKYSSYESSKSTDDILNDFSNNLGDNSYYWMIDSDDNIILSKDMGASIMSMVETTTPVTGFYGDGTSSKPYLVGSVADLEYLSNQVNNGTTYDGKYFQLAADIVLTDNFTSIGTIDNSFRGNFDGAGHSISNMSIYISGSNNDTYSYGFFGSIGGGSSQTIKNIEFINPSFELDFSYSSSYTGGYYLGTVAGVMYNNSHIQNIVVNDLSMVNDNAFKFSNNRLRLQVGGIAGLATNTSNNDDDPGSSKRYSISDSYVSSDIDFSNITASSRSYSLYSSVGGIIGGIDDQPVWPENCLYEGNVNSPNTFIGPIFGYVRTGTSTTANNFNNYFMGNGAGSLTMSSYYYNYRVRNSKTFTSSVQSGTTSNSTSYRMSTSTSNIGYVQGVNKGLYLTSYTNYNNLLTSWNNSTSDIKYTYTNNTYHLVPRINASVDEPNDGYYVVSLNDSYNSSNYTYSWYKNRTLDNTFTSNTYTYDDSSIEEMLVDKDIDCIVYDGTYYSIAKFTIPKLELNLIINVNKTNKSATAHLEGDALKYLSLSDYTYQWYREDITGLDSAKIDVATGLSITNMDSKYDYKLVATNNKYPQMSITESVSLVDRTVIYVDNVYGSNNNDGLTEDTAVATIANAYQKLPANGVVDSNIVVVMGQYITNDFLYGATSTTQNNYSKAATVTGLYKSKDYNTDLRFYGQDPSSTTTTGRYLYADTKIMYMDLNGINGTSKGMTYFYCQGHSLTIGKGVTMTNYASTSNTNGLISNTTAPNFHIFGGFSNYNLTDIPSNNNNGTITIQSGTYARVLMGGRNTGTNNTSHNMLGTATNPFNMHLIVDIEESTTTSTYAYDINLMTGGQTDGSIRANSVIDIINGKIGRVIGGSIGYTASNRTSTSYPMNSYFGSTTINFYNGSINELYGASLGRSNDTTVDNTYYYGNTTMNIYGGTIQNNIYSAGAGAVTGYNENSTDPFKNLGQSYPTSANLNIYGGVMNGNIYGAGYGYSAYINSTQIPTDGGSLYGDSNLNITGGTINGNIYGAGRGTNSYGTNKNKLAQMVGNANLTISGNVKITGSVYGAGEGINNSYYTETARLTGNSNIYLSKDFSIPIYGGGNASGVTGTTNIYLNSGKYTSDIYGGGNLGDVIGTSIINLNNSTVGTLYGAGKQGDSTNTTINLNGGSATTIYGGGYQSNVTNSTSILLNGSNTTNIYGGSNQSGTINNTVIDVTSGAVTTVYGGNNAGGTSTLTTILLNGPDVLNVYGGGNSAVNKSSNIYINKGNIGTLFGGGNLAASTSSNIKVKGGVITTLYGGGNKGDVNISTLDVYAGTINDLYSGGNEASVTTPATSIYGGDITNMFGGGNNAESGTTNVYTYGGNITNLYGGGNKAGVTTSNVNMYGGNITNSFGGSNQTGQVINSNIKALNSKEKNDFKYDISIDAVDSTWQSSDYKTYVTITVNMTNSGDTDITDWEYQFNIPKSSLYANWTMVDISLNGDIYTANSTNRYNSNQKEAIPANSSYSFTFYVLTNISKEELNVESTLVKPVIIEVDPLNIGTIYGGNNNGGSTSTSNVYIENGTIGTVFGGGNNAVTSTSNVDIEGGTITNVFGGGNEAGITMSSSVKAKNASILENLYGGGNNGAVNQNTNVYLSNMKVIGSVYAGGNGSSATVLGNTTLTLDGNTVVGTDTSIAPAEGSIFGSGKAASTGVASVNNSVATVNIVGATIYGNVYGGANTSVVYGKTKTNIGTGSVNDESLTEGNINIMGTVFGGGEANAAGSDTYDYSFICVTTAIDININGEGYINNGHTFLLNGSIFGSGNASSSSGTSNIIIKNLGTKDVPSRNISIQRSDSVVLDHSYIELKGTTDRTNEYSSIKYSFNRVDSLTIKNNTSLLLQQNANLLKEFNSMVDVDGVEVAADVNIGDDGTVVKNVDNRVYIVPNKNLNITTNEAATSYGKITGMSFFGMYNSYANGSLNYGVYDSKFNNGDSADAGDVVIGGSYILGLHSLNHDITKNGFYSNFLNDDYTLVSTNYIEPSPPDSNYYMWSIGAQSINYSFALTASKYSSLGTYELSMLDFSSGDTIFNVIGFNSDGLTSGVNLVDSNNVPKVADTAAKANSTLGLSMKSETTEWTSYDTTKFLSSNDGSYSGDTSYKTDSKTVAPSLMFYLYHAKNISLDQDLGTVVVSLQALTPVDEVSYDVQLITISIDLNARNYDDGDSYDASITYDKKYEMPSATSVNITNKSQFTAYYSLYANSESFNKFYGVTNNYYHALSSNVVLPVGTTITMLDYGADSKNPEYYYYTVTDDSYKQSVSDFTKNNEATYRLSNFIKMGSTSSGNTYSDSENNVKYYNSDNNLVSEEFLFIFDFKDTNITGNMLDNSILFELRNGEDRAVISVLGIRQTLMKYSLYETSNLVLNQNINFSSNYIYHNFVNIIDYSTVVSYNQTGNRESIINTNYESSNMGLNIYLYDSSGNQITSSTLGGTTFKIDGVNYYVDSDGVYRIKLAGKVADLNKKIYLSSDGSIPAGSYTVRFVLFASSDGLHNSNSLSDSENNIDVVAIGNDNAILVKCDDTTKIVDGDTALNEKGEAINKYTITYKSELKSPNLRLSVYKRDITSKDSTVYNEIPFNKLFTNTLILPKNAGFIGSSVDEMMLTATPGADTELKFNIKPVLTSGTYKLVFKLYDNNQLIEDANEYVIVKKEINE